MPSSADVVEEHRIHLLRVAYRLTGTLADAEDALQEAWLRLARLPDADRAAIRDPRSAILVDHRGRAAVPGPAALSGRAARAATSGRGCLSRW